MTSRSAILLLVACAAAGVSPAALAWDGAAITYFTAQLEPSVGTLLDLRDGHARIRDSVNRERRIPLDQLAAIYFEDSQPLPVTAPDAPGALLNAATAAQGLLVTTDLQRLRGKPVEGDPGPEAVLWDGPPFGTRVFPLESLRVYRPGAGGAANLFDTSDKDVIIYKNADRAPTFVESIVVTPPQIEAQAAPARDEPFRNAAALQRARRAAEMRRTLTMISGVVRADVQNVPTDIPLERIQAITFANPPERPRPLPRAWLNDSSVVASSTLTLEVPAASKSGSLRRLGDISIQLDEPGQTPALILTMPDAGPGSSRAPSTVQSTSDPTGRIPLPSVRAIAIDASRLVPLSACEIRSEAIPDSARRWTPPARVDSPLQASAPLDAFDITLPGPMQVTIDLPPTATHVGGTIALPLAARPLGSCRVRLAMVDAAGATHEFATVELSAKAPSFPVSAAVPSDTSGPFRLRVTLDPTDDGPIQDSVVLRRFLVMRAP